MEISIFRLERYVLGTLDNAAGFRDVVEANGGIMRSGGEVGGGRWRRGGRT